jgi:FdhD protein
MKTFRAMARVGGKPRTCPDEVAVALTFNGTTQAVMMATPADLEDFAYGFALTEGTARPQDIESVTVVETPLGVDLQVWTTDAAAERLAARRRSMLGPVGCGLCGIDSLEQAMREPMAVTARLVMTAEEVRQAMVDLPGHQPLHDATRGVHGAAFWQPGKGIVLAREDVGRHNALDKLIGAVARASLGPGAVLITSRVSIDLVQKCAALGAPVLVAVSAPTAAAVDMAARAGMTLVAGARPDGFDVYTHAERIKDKTHVA